MSSPPRCPGMPELYRTRARRLAAAVCVWMSLGVAAWIVQGIFRVMPDWIVWPFWYAIHLVWGGLAGLAAAIRPRFSRRGWAEAAVFCCCAAFPLWSDRILFLVQDFYSRGLLALQTAPVWMGVRWMPGMIAIVTIGVVIGLVFALAARSLRLFAGAMVVALACGALVAAANEAPTIALQWAAGIAQMLLLHIGPVLLLLAAAATSWRQLECPTCWGCGYELPWAGCPTCPECGRDGSVEVARWAALARPTSGL